MRRFGFHDSRSESPRNNETQKQQERLDKLEGALQELQREHFENWRGCTALISKVVKKVSVLGDQIAVLSECLARINVLPAETFSAQLHRKRFAAKLKENPLPATLDFISFMQTAGVPLMIGLFTGIPAIGAAASVSHTIHSNTIDVMPALRELNAVHIYVCGGKSAEASLLESAVRLNPACQTWEVVPRFAQPRVGATCGVIDGKIYMCGGKTELGAAVKSLERFDPQAGVWEALPPMQFPRWGLSTTVLDGRLYACGGCDEFMRAGKITERFDPLGFWEVNAPMLESRAWAAAGHVGGVLYVCGGRRQEELLSSVERFRPATGTWEIGPPLHVARSGACSASASQRLFVCGGRSSAHILRSVESLTPEANVWEKVESMSTGRFCAAAVAVANRVYVFGGYGYVSRVGHYLDSGEVYIPTRGRWSALPCMPERRSYLAACVVHAH